MPKQIKTPDSSINMDVKRGNVCIDYIMDLENFHGKYSFCKCLCGENIIFCRTNKDKINKKFPYESFPNINENFSLFLGTDDDLDVIYRLRISSLVRNKLCSRLNSSLWGEVDNHNRLANPYLDLNNKLSETQKTLH